jgi:hypothetical protein
MKQHTTPEQTAKLIELGFAPKMRIKGVCTRYGTVNIEHETYFDVAKLIEVLSNDDVATTKFVYDRFNWFVDWDLFDKIHQTVGVELVDALYDMVIKLKENGVI